MANSKSIQRNIVLIIGLVCCGLAMQDARGLGQRLPVQYIRAIAADLELTPIQAENLTKQQAYNYLIAEYPALPAARIKEFRRFWPGIKEMLLRDAIERRTQDRLILFKQQLTSLYPDAVGLQTEYAKDTVRQLLPLLYGEVDPNDL